MEGGTMEKKWLSTLGSQLREMPQMKVKPKKETENCRVRVTPRSRRAKVEQTAHSTDAMMLVRKPGGAQRSRQDRKTRLCKRCGVQRCRQGND